MIIRTTCEEEGIICDETIQGEGKTANLNNKTVCHVTAQNKTVTHLISDKRMKVETVTVIKEQF